MKDYKRLMDSEAGQAITDLLIEFDEMGFAPTTVCPDSEQYAIDWRERVRKEIARLTAENQRLREEVAEQKSIAEHKHATQMEWFSIACEYKAENDVLRKRLNRAVELPLLKIEETNDMLLIPKYFDFTIRVKIKWLMNENKNFVANMEYNIEEEKKFLKELGNLCEKYGVKADYKLEISKQED